MDLRSIINNDGSEGAGGQNKAQPATPVQPNPSLGLYREYSQQSQSSQPSLSRQTSQDYTAQAPQFASPTAYQGAYQGRPSAPLQPPNNDLRSPVASSQYLAQSPFRQTSSSSTSGGPYPFPSNAAAPQSPGQHQEHIGSLSHRESFPRQDHAPPSQHSAYPQASSIPLTPPIGSGSNSYPLLQHQRSQSSQSSSTPTSGQNQHFYAHPPQDSPITSNAHPPTPFAAPEQRQRSYPGTPLGPPISIQRQPTGGYPMPASPNQQRQQSLGILNQDHRNDGLSPSPSVNMAPSTPGSYSSHRLSAPDTQRVFQTDREQSMSVSPKTTVVRLPSQDSTSGMVPQVNMVPESTPGSTKRKMDDRQSSPPQARHYSEVSSKSSPVQQPRKRRRHNERPIWAQSWPEYQRQKQRQGRETQARQQQPVARQANGHPPAAVAPQAQARAPPAGPPLGAKTDELLGPWEPSISDTTPVNDLTKVVADFFFLQVVNRNDWGELQSRGVQVEIEAKLGQLIDKETNQRYWLPVASECVLAPSNRVSFRSSMTEEQHKRMNGFLNEMVTEAHPSNVNRPKPRVPIQYAHRRERDSFYELPQPLVNTLPASIQELLRQGPNKRHAVKVRISHDQKTGQVLAAIIKTRVKDLDIFMPSSPLDCRISVNLEMRYDGDIEALTRGVDKQNQPDRLKDRLSYTQSHYQIDLTQVTSTAGEKEHELEIEIDTRVLVEQGLRVKSGQPHRYDSLVEGLMNNIHVLTKELT